MLVSTLENIQDKKKLVGIRTDYLDWDQVIIGYVIRVTEDELILNEVDEYGRYIGQLVINCNRILNIEYDDPYQKRLQFLIDNNLKMDFTEQVYVRKNDFELTYWIEKVVNEKRIVKLFFDEDYYVVGVIQKFDSEYLLINNLGEDGSNDGYSIHPINQLIGIRFNGPTEKKVELLLDYVASRKC